MTRGKVAIAAASFGMLVLAGCASQGTAPPAPIAASPGTMQDVAKGDTSDVQCIRMYPTGSHLPKIVCTTQQERDAEQSGAERVMHDAQQRMGPKCSPHCSY